MEAKKSFAEASTLGSQDKMQEISMLVEVDPSILTMFLETCMELLRNSKAMEGLQEIINKCACKEKIHDKHCVVRMIVKYKA